MDYFVTRIQHACAILSCFLTFTLEDIPCAFGEEARATTVDSQKRADLAFLSSILAKSDFQNVFFDFTLVETHKSRGTSHSRVVYWCNGTQVLSGRPDSLFKIEYAPRNTVWEDGAAPYLQEETTIAYNGHLWIEVLYKSGPIGATATCNLAEISESRPRRFERPRWNSGEDFFIGHATFNGKQTIGQFLEALSRLPDQAKLEFARLLNIEHDSSAGIIKIVMALPSDNPTQISELWLDLKRDGALQKNTIRVQRRDGGWFETKAEVLEFSEVSGFHFPSRARRTVRSPERETVVDFTATNYRLIDKGAGLYEVALPPGTRVSDSRIDRTFVVERGAFTDAAFVVGPDPSSEKIP